MEPWKDTFLDIVKNLLSFWHVIFLGTILVLMVVLFSWMLLG